jgi:cytochrome c-type biogenesis protein CcmH/NrfG
MALVGITVAAFVGTRAIAQSIDVSRRRQAIAWYDVAQRARVDGDAESAVQALRRAVSKDVGNRQYRLALADALAARRLDAEARRVLLALRDTQPEDPETNLRLARIEAHGADADVARRYYQSALSSLWKPEHAEARRRVRVELIEFLLQHKERARALSELLLLAASLPQDAKVHAQVGRMFLAAGNAREALDHFVRAVRLDSSNADALLGAGEAAFELRDYSRALRYLKQVAQENARAAELRNVSELVLNTDPLAPRLSATERRRRLSLALQQALQRLNACLGGSVEKKGRLELLRTDVRDFEDALEARQRQEVEHLIDDGVDLVYRAERASEQHCTAALAPLDRALLLIARRHGLDDQ